MKRMILFLLAGMLIMSPAYAQDDDSVPYFPYPEPQQTTPAPAPKTTTTKKKTPAKKTTTKKAATTKKSTPKPAPKPSSLQQGITLMQQEKYEQAKPYLLKAIQENRNDPNVWYWYGVYHERTGGFYQAQYFYSKAVTIDPTFEPLSRVVYYPEDSEKTPLWDPKRPARVYPVEVASTGGISGVPAGLPGRSSFPEAPNDPEMPHVPVYTPPEPGAAPFDGDAWSPAVYVPPRPEEIQTEGEMSPTYLPPQPQSIIAQNSPTARQVLEIPVYRYPEGYEEQQTAQRDNVVRADKPLYTPPNPGEKQQTPPASTTQTVKKQTAPAKIQTASTQRTASVPTSRVVRSNTKTTKKAATRSTPASTSTRQNTTRPTGQRAQPASRDVRPAAPAQPTQPTQSTPPTQPETSTPEPVTLPPESAPSRPERPRDPQYLPPVGQQTPDPGTISDAPMPPVGQGSQD